MNSLQYVCIGVYGVFLILGICGGIALLVYIFKKIQNYLQHKPMTYMLYGILSLMLLRTVYGIGKVTWNTIKGGSNDK